MVCLVVLVEVLLLMNLMLVELVAQEHLDKGMLEVAQ